jgi:hypothetical protein
MSDSIIVENFLDILRENGTILKAGGKLLEKE